MNENNQIFMFDGAQNKTSNPRSITSVAKKKHIYTVLNGQEKDYRVEAFFSKIEGNASALFRKIQTTGFENLLSDEIPKLIDFITLLFIRTERATGIADEVMKKDTVVQNMRAINIEGADKIIAACSQKKGLAYALTLPLHFDYRHKVLTDNFDLYLLTSEQNAPPFVLNDMFACIEMVSNNAYRDEGNIDWGKMNVRKHFPVTNKHCISFVPKTDRSKVGTSEINCTKAVLNCRDTQIINQLSFQQKERYAYCAQKSVLESLAF